MKKNPDFKQMIEDGWEWIIAPTLVDDMFPLFAQIAQKALSTGNHVGITTGELETQLTFSDLLHDNGFTENKDWEAAAVSFVEDLCVPCAGGGPGASHVRLMDNVANTIMQYHVCLGTTFWQAISTTAFHDKSNLHILTRSALCMVNLTTNIKEDGNAKCITKQDITKLADKGSVQKAADAEKALKEGMQIVEALVRGNPSLTDAEFVQCIGKLFVRVGLWSTNNMMKGDRRKGDVIG